jgi:hypothetical protein
MMHGKHDGGSVFPNLTPTNPQIEYCDRGMSLRDWFAGQALANTASNYRGTAFDPAGVARAAYEYADAMLEARK